MAAEDDSDFSDVDLDTIRERAAIRAARREISALCHEMTAAVDLLVSPHLARQEIQALCRSMTEEVDAVAAPQIGRSLKRVARADFENWLADRKTRWRAARGYVAPPPIPSRDAQRAVVAELQQKVVRMELENAYLRSMLVERSPPARKS